MCNCHQDRHVFTGASLWHLLLSRGSNRASVSQRVEISDRTDNALIYFPP